MEKDFVKSYRSKLRKLKEQKQFSEVPLAVGSADPYCEKRFLLMGNILSNPEN